MLGFQVTIRSFASRFAGRQNARQNFLSFRILGGAGFAFCNLRLLISPWVPWSVFLLQRKDTLLSSSHASKSARFARFAIRSPSVGAMRFSVQFCWICQFCSSFFSLFAFPLALLRLKDMYIRIRIKLVAQSEVSFSLRIDKMRLSTFCGQNAVVTNLREIYIILFVLRTVFSTTESARTPCVSTFS